MNVQWEALANNQTLSDSATALLRAFGHARTINRTHPREVNWAVRPVTAQCLIIRLLGPSPLVITPANQGLGHPLRSSKAAHVRTRCAVPRASSLMNNVGDVSGRIPRSLNYALLCEPDFGPDLEF